MILPESWVEVRLSDICTINPKFSKEELPDEGALVTFVSMSAIDATLGAITASDLRNYEDVSKGYTPFSENDVLFAKVTPCMENGKAAIVGPLSNDIGFGSTEFHVFRPTKAVLSEFIFYFIRQKAFRKRAASAHQGTGGLQRVPASFISRLKIPLPTLKEQQRIVYLLKHAEKLAELRAHNDELISRAKKQLFLEMFGLPNPKKNSKWPIAKLGSLAKVGTGGTPSRQQDDNYGGNVAWVKSTDLKDSHITITDEYIHDIATERSNAKVYPKDTIMLAMYGQGQTRGRTGKILVEASCNQACAALLTNEELHPDYLWTWFQLSYDFVRSLGRGGQQENLNLDIVRNIYVPKPPIKLQIEFSRRLTQLLKIENHSNSLKLKMEETVEALKTEALTGEATSIWRTQHAEEMKKSFDEQNQLLREIGTISSNIKPEKEKVVVQNFVSSSKSRQWLTKELSEFQRQVFSAFQKYEQQPLFAEDSELFSQFCESDGITDRLNKFGLAINNRIRRTLSQLASLGLIAKITVPKSNQETGESEYLKAFRPLRKDEYTRLKDISKIRSHLSIEEKSYFFIVEQDFETLSRAGADGLFQVISLVDSEDEDKTELVNVGKHYQSLEELKDDLARRLMTSIEKIELETE